MYLDLVLVCIAVHLAHSVPDCSTSPFDTCLKCLESSADVHMLILLSKEDLYFRLLLRPHSFLSLGHTWLAVILEGNWRDLEHRSQLGACLC